MKCFLAPQSFPPLLILPEIKLTGYRIETFFPQKQIFTQTLDTKMIELGPICLIPISFRENKISNFLNMQDKK